jgi:ubiquinone/menaquinone biosynthesis C-methylase UbiE
MKDFKTHWDSVYKDPEKIRHTWTQHVPELTLTMIDQLNLAKDAAIIDIGGGDSTLVDHFLERGYTNVTVLDISMHALNRSKKRLGENAKLVKWICGNVLETEFEQQYQLWIDRATFHFLQNHSEIELYREKVKENTKAGSSLIIATFSEEGPEQCSGLPVKQYSAYALTDVFKSSFDRKRVILEDHTTPSGTLQKFIYILFQKRKPGEQANHSISEAELFKTDRPISVKIEGPNCSIDQKGCCC